MAPVEHVVNATGGYRVTRVDTVRTSALALVPLVDPWTGAAPAAVRVESLTPQVRAHVTAGHVVLTGLSERCWPHLDTTAQQARLRLTVPGLSAEEVVLSVPAASALPWMAPPLPVPASLIALTGTVSQRDFPNDPIVGATVEVSGNQVAVHPPLSAEHPVGASVRPRPLGAPAVSTTVSADAEVGEHVIEVAATAGFAAGRVVDVGGQLVGTVESLLGGALLRLTAPLPVAVRAGDPVSPRAPGAPSAGSVLARQARAGDGLLSTLAALAAAFVEVGGPVPEIRATTLVTDARGQWRLAGVRGVPTITLTTSRSGYAADGPTTHPVQPTDPFVINTALHP